jgi:hypothetical protein
MANVKISQLPLATSPLDSAVEMPVVQGGVTKRAGMTTIGFLQSGTGAVLRTAQDKMRETVSVKDFGAVGNGVADDTAAIQAAINSSAELVVFPQGTYRITSALTVPSGNKTLMSLGWRAATINQDGAAVYTLDIGSASVVTFDVRVEGFVFTRTSAAASGAVIRLRNVVYWQIDNCRLFMDNKAWRGLEIYSGFNGRCFEVLSENPIREHVYVSGGTNPGGNLDGVSVQNYFFETEMAGGNDGQPAATSGCILLDDNVQATIVQSPRVYSHTGYAVYCKGTLANRGNNALNLFYDLNVEASPGKTAGAIRIDNYTSSQVRIGWVSSLNIPAIHLTANCQSTITADIQAGIGGAGSYGYQDDGTQNTLQNLDVVGYTAGGSGVYLGSTVNTPVINGLTARQTTYVVEVDAGITSSTYVDISEVAFTGLSSTPFTGELITGTTASINDVKALGTNPFISSSSTITPPAGFTAYYVLGTTAINTINPTFFGQIVTLRFRDVNGRINDAAVAGGNVQLQTAGSNFTSTGGRGSITLQYDGSSWIELSRSPG